MVGVQQKTQSCRTPGLSFSLRKRTVAMTGRRKEGVSLLIEMRCKDSHIFTIFQTFLQKIRNSSEIIPIKLASINTFIYLCTTFISRSIDNLNLSENNSKNTWRFADFFVSLQRPKMMVDHPVRASDNAQSSRLGIFIPSCEHHRRLPFA